MKFLRVLLLLILLALLGYVGISVFSPHHQEVDVERSSDQQSDSVVVGIPEGLIDAALQADSTAEKSGDSAEKEPVHVESEQKSQSGD